jgi:hypothetical protein
MAVTFETEKCDSKENTIKKRKGDGSFGTLQKAFDSLG